MKRTIAMSLMVLSAGQFVFAEPVFMPQAASVVKAKGMEAGFAAQYGYQKSELEASPGTTFNTRTVTMPISLRYGILDNLESHLMLPIVHAIDSSEGILSSREEDGGLGNMQLGAKYNFLMTPVPIAVGLDLDMPTANSANNAAATGNRYSAQTQQGFNGHLFVVADTPRMADMFSGHVSLGYMNTGTFTTASDTRFNPSDLMTFGAGVDMDLKKLAEGLTASGEMVGNTALTHSRTNGDINGGNDMGQVLEAGPAIRWHKDAFKAYSGVLWDAGPATYRAYNWRAILGLAIVFGAK